ncbi:hypothetical protein GOBAR_DD23195 [Gossypium barbadense]|nr:hypothetical protein GOBAR_DD23195 [Gossypium barbadense]
MSVRENRKSYPRFNNVDDALTLFHKMIVEHPKPSIVEFTKLLRAILGVKPDVVTFSTLIRGLCNRILDGVCKTGNTDGAIRYLRMMEERGFEPDVVAYSTVLNCLCKKGLLKEAHDLFFEMIKQGIKPNVVTYSILIDALCKQGMISKAEDIVGIMTKQGIKPNVVTY